MNSFIEFIVKDLLGQASILIAFIAMLGLILQKKSPGKIAEGTFKTLLGFLIMMAGINIIVATLTFLNDIFTHGFGMKGYITDVAAIAGLANRELGSEVALTLMVIFAVNIIIARLTPLKYIFLTGQALLWMATIGAAIGYKAGLTGLPLILTGGIFGGAMALGAYSGVGPFVQAISKVLSSGVNFLVDAKLLPLVNIIIEPGKVLFLNNAINHGVITPLAAEEVARVGKSMLFMLESNPGPGLGILLAYWLVGRGSAKQSAPGAVVIHFFGGIHEIYFPYILMKPVLILAAIAGGVAGTFTFQLTGAALSGAPSPGSILTYIMMTPKGGFLPMFSGVIVAAVVSFLVAALLLKTGKKNDEELDLEEALAKMKEMKSAGVNTQAAAEAVTSVRKDAVNKIVFACDAGMGSSAMGASVLRKKMQDAGVKVTVVNSAVSEIPDDADIVITQKTLTERAKANKPDAEHISIDNFLKSPKYDELVERLKG